MKKTMSILLSLVASSYIYASEIKNSESIALTDVIITAQKEEDKLANVPISVSVLSGQDIEEQNIIDTQDIANSVSGLSMIRTGSHGIAGFLSLRGITPTMEGEQAIGFFVDDVYFPMFDSEILDIQRVEVLKGPQGSLYGKNTEAGVINIITNKPQNEDSAFLSVDIGNYNTQKYKVILNKSITEDLYIRGAFRKYLSDGYFTNKYNGNDALDKVDGFDGRIALRYLPSDNLDIILSYDRNDYDNGYTGFTTLQETKNNPGDVNTDFEGESLYTNDKLALKAIYEEDDFTFTSITGISKTENHDKNDLDFSSYDVMRLNIDKEVEFLSQEFRINSKIGDNFDYLLGAYASSQKDDQSVGFDMRQANPTYGIPAFKQTTKSTINTDTYALFAQGNYVFSDFFDITAGLRYNLEKKDIDYKQYYNVDLSAFGKTPSSANKSNDFKQVLPKLSFNFNLDNHLIYTSFTKGYKSGGFNPLAPSAKYLSYEEEESFNYELGIKSHFLDDRLFTSLSIYHIEIDNQQVEVQLYPDSITSNAGQSKVDGVELELKYQANDNLLLSFGSSYNDSKFDEYTDNVYDGNGNTTGTVSYKGKSPTNTPKYTYNVSAKYNFSEDTYLLGKLNAYGKMYYDLDNTVKEDAYNIVDLTFNTKVSGFGVKLYGKNIFDKNYATRAFEYGTSWYARVGSPRTFGISLSKKF